MDQILTPESRDTLQKALDVMLHYVMDQGRDKHLFELQSILANICVTISSTISCDFPPMELTPDSALTYHGNIPGLTAEQINRYA